MKLLDRLEGLRPIAPLLVIAFFILSIAFSALSAEPGSLFLWIIFGLLGIVFLRVAFPRSYLYGLWLLVVYVLAGVGVLFINGIGLAGGQGIGVGILLELLAVYIVYHLIFQVKGLRDIGEGPYVPLGLWAVSVVLFYLFSIGAVSNLIGWAQAAPGDGELGGYIAFEVLMVPIVVFIFARAEECIRYLEEGPRALRGGRVAKPRAMPTSTTRMKKERGGPLVRAKRMVKGGGGCPVCHTDLSIVRRTCPECNAREDTAVCKKGHVFLPCPSCGTANFHGDYRCKKCNARLSESILCRECGKESGLQLWRKVKPAKKARG